MISKQEKWVQTADRLGIRIELNFRKTIWNQKSTNTVDPLYLRKIRNGRSRGRSKIALDLL